MKQNIVESLKLGAWVTAAVLVLNYILSFMKVDVIQLYGLRDYINPVTGITPTVTTKVVNFINGLGIVNIDIASLVTLYLSAAVIVFVGSLIYGAINLPKGLSGWQKLAAVLFWGTIPFGILLTWGMSIPSATVVIMLALYYIFVALTFGVLQKVVTKFVRI